MQKEEWKKNLARDFISLGGIPFFILVIVRIWLLNNYFYLGEILISGLLFLSISYFFKINLYSGLALISLIYTGIYYADFRYWGFVSLVYLCLIFSLIYLGNDKKKIFFGVFIGFLASTFKYVLNKVFI